MDLKYFFQENPKVALAFSSGVDSAYLLYAAMENGAQVRAYYVKSVFQPQFELADARRLAAELGADMRELKAEVLDPAIAANPADRCYYCKKKIFAAIAETAAADGFPVLMDGTNASDNAGDRPGMRALAELSVRSPLRECGLTKDEIRRRSKEAGLFTWDKPAYACLATRIPTGTEITRERLCRTEAAESYLAEIGLTDFRVRMIAADNRRTDGCGEPRRGMSGSSTDLSQGKMPGKPISEVQPDITAGDSARIQVREQDIPLVLSRRQAILDELKKYYNAVLLDLEVR